MQQIICTVYKSNTFTSMCVTVFTLHALCQHAISCNLKHFCIYLNYRVRELFESTPAAGKSRLSLHDLLRDKKTVKIMQVWSSVLCTLPCSLYLYIYRERERQLCYAH